MNASDQRVPSWEHLQSNLKSKQTDTEQSFRENVQKGLVASPLNTIRLFHETDTEEDIRVTFSRDHASWCKFRCVCSFCFVYICIYIVKRQKHPFGTNDSLLTAFPEQKKARIVTRYGLPWKKKRFHTESKKST